MQNKDSLCKQETEYIRKNEVKSKQNHSDIENRAISYFELGDMPSNCVEGGHWATSCMGSGDWTTNSYETTNCMTSCNGVGDWTTSFIQTSNFSPNCMGTSDWTFKLDKVLPSPTNDIIIQYEQETNVESHL